MSLLYCTDLNPENKQAELQQEMFMLHLILSGE